MRIPERFFLNAYSAAIRLYPDSFRWRYHAQMLDAVHHTYAEQKTLSDDLRLASALVLDTARGVAREHGRRSSPVRSVYLLGFALLFSIVQIAASLSYHRYLRMAVGCHPSMRVSKIVAEASAQPIHAAMDLGGARTELATTDWLESNESFAAIYDAEGRPLASDATLHGALPHPPASVFAGMKTDTLGRVQWQPEHGIRVALVGQGLPHGGFVLAGSSLLEAEIHEARFQNGMVVLWIMMAGTILILMRRPRPRRHIASPHIAPPHNDTNTA